MLSRVKDGFKRGYVYCARGASVSELLFEVKGMKGMKVKGVTIRRVKGGLGGYAFVGSH